MEGRRNYLRLIVVIVLSGLVVGFGLSGAMAKKKPKYVFKVATLAPDNVGWAVFVKNKMFKLLSEFTDGEVGFDIYWGGVMGDEEDYIAKMRIGQLQGAGFSGAGAVMVCPEMSVLELPFMFRNYKEVSYIRKKMRDTFIKVVEKNGFILFGWCDQDFDQIYSTKFEMRTPDEFAKSKILSWYGPLEVEMLKALGASPIPVNVPEAITSMRSGVGDAGIGPAIWMVGAQVYTFTKYVNTVPIRYSPVLMVGTMKAWNSVPKRFHEELKKQTKLIADMENEFNEFTHKANKQCIKAMIKYGVKEVKMNSEEIDVFKKRTAPIWNKLAGKQYSKELLEEVVAHLEKFRAMEAKNM